MQSTPTYTLYHDMYSHVRKRGAHDHVDGENWVSRRAQRRQKRGYKGRKMQGRGTSAQMEDRKSAVGMTQSSSSDW